MPVVALAVVAAAVAEVLVEACAVLQGGLAVLVDLQDEQLIGIRSVQHIIQYTKLQIMS